MECYVLASARLSLLRRQFLQLPSGLRTPTSTHPARQRYYSVSPVSLHTNSPDAKPDTGASQAYPLSGYYSDILSTRIHHRGQPTTSVSSPPHPPATSPSAATEMTPQEKMAIVFGTRLAGPGRSPRYEPGSEPVWKTINDVAIPPRPEEPDNCCMSGCVNCVWDNYRDEMEEWAALLAHARAKGPSKAVPQPVTAPRPEADIVSVSMDDDGGGSDTNWSLPTPGEDLFADIPVGIREFMKTEKKLKQLHQQEETRR